MPTFLNHEHPVSASLLDATSGESLIPIQPGVQHSRRRGVLETAGGAREASVVSPHRPRRMTIVTGDLTQPEHDALAVAVLASRGGSGAIEARHPDDHPAVATLWRLIEGVEFSRDTPHLTTSTVVLEEL